MGSRWMEHRLNFKMHDEDGEKRLLQAFASVIRTSHDRMIDALKVGKVITVLWYMD